MPNNIQPYIISKCIYNNTKIPLFPNPDKIRELFKDGSIYITNIGNDYTELYDTINDYIITVTIIKPYTLNVVLGGISHSIAPTYITDVKTIVREYRLYMLPSIFNDYNSVYNSVYNHIIHSEGHSYHSNILLHIMDSTRLLDKISSVFTNINTIPIMELFFYRDFMKNFNGSIYSKTTKHPVIRTRMIQYSIVYVNGNRLDFAKHLGKIINIKCEYKSGKAIIMGQSTWLERSLKNLITSNTVYNIRPK